MLKRKLVETAKRSFIAYTCLGLIAVSNVLFCARGAAVDESPGLDLKEYEDELSGVVKREPSCLVDKNGLPRRVIVTRNGAGLFEKPEEGAKRIKSVGMFDRLYLYVEETAGFRRVGGDPFGEAAAGWIPSSFCLDWNSDEGLFLNSASIPDDVKQVLVWKTAEDAIEGDPEKAIFSENPAEAHASDVFFPVLQRDTTGTAFQIGFVFGGDQGNRNQYGKQLSEQERTQVLRNLSVINIVLLMDSTGSMSGRIEEAKNRAVALVDRLEHDTLVKSLDDSRKIQLTVNFSLIAYRDVGDEFEVQQFVPLTNDRDVIKNGISSLTASGGGDEAEMVVDAVRKLLDMSGLDQGELTVGILVGDAPPHEEDEKLLAELGTELRARSVTLHALVCGDSRLTESTFESIATASGGHVLKLEQADSVVEAIVKQIKTRLVTFPVETELVEIAVSKGTTILEAGREIGLSDRETRMVQQNFLVARGADVAPSGIEFRNGWVKVRPGTESRLRLHVLTPRWKLAQTLARMLGLTNDIGFKPGVADKARALVGTALGLLAGGTSASAGLEKSGQSATERGGSVPEPSLVVKRGESAAVRFNQANRAKILKLIEYWRNAALWQHEHAYIPVDLLP